MRCHSAHRYLLQMLAASRVDFRECRTFTRWRGWPDIRSQPAIERKAMTSDLRLLIKPRSVAIIGASVKPGTPGHDAFRNLVHHSDIPDGVHLVHPRRDDIEGHPTVPDVGSLPTGVDTAMVLVRADQVVEAVAACGSHGIKFAIVPAGGLGETGDAGRRVEANLLRVARETGIRLYGTNCPGLTNVNDGVLLSVSPSAPLDRRGGSIGLITHGGGPGRTVMQYMDRDVGIGCWLSGGNEVDLHAGDFVTHLVGDPRIKVIACILEGVKDGPGLLTATRAAAEAGKPVVVMLVGRTALGASAAQSHTAHLATPARVLRGALRQSGALLVDDLDELVETASLLTRPWPKGKVKACVVSFSGGAAIAAVDSLCEAGVDVPNLRSSTVARLRESLPKFATATNPLDLTLDLFRRPGLFPAALRILEKDPGVDTLVVPVPADYGDVGQRFSQNLVEHAGSHPETWVVPAWTSPRAGAGFRELAAAGLHPFTRVSTLAKALRRVEEFEEWRDAPSMSPVASERLMRQREWTPAETWTERAGKQLLEAGGVDIPAGAVVRSAAQAAAAAADLSWPVVLKIHNAGVLHKTDIGAVRLGLKSEQSVLEAWAAVEQALDVRGVVLEAALVEEEAAPGLDTFLSVRRDPTFGYVVTTGVGGVLSELYDDVAIAVAGVNRVGLDRMLRGLRGWPLFVGHRGAPAVDLDALWRTVQALTDILGSRPDVIEVEVNPLRLYASGCRALDVVVTATRPDDMDAQRLRR